MLKKRLFGITVLFAAFGIILAISLEGCGNEPLPLFSDHLDSDEPTQGLVYELIGMGYSVSRGEATAAQVVIPTSHEGLPVTAITNYGFSSYSNMTSIIIPDSVTRIGDGAFIYCSGLTSIIIPNSVTSIGGGAFFNCTGLTKVYYGGANITDWNKINLSWGNSYLLSADRYYYSETNPGTPNSHWRWVGNVLTIWN